MIRRLGQGTFRARLLDAYGRRCAITGERTEPVLDAAHIQPYLGPRSNHIRNGLVLSKEFHTLFDLGYVGIDPDYKVHVSPRLYDEWHNGRRYYEYDDRGGSGCGFDGRAARHSFSAVRSPRPSSYASEQVTHSRICCSVSRLFARSSSWSR
jgi:hypothetical protein